MTNNVIENIKMVPFAFSGYNKITMKVSVTFKYGEESIATSESDDDEHPVKKRKTTKKTRKFNIESTTKRFPFAAPFFTYQCKIIKQIDLKSESEEALNTTQDWYELTGVICNLEETTKINYEYVVKTLKKMCKWISGVKFAEQDLNNIFRLNDKNRIFTQEKDLCVFQTSELRDVAVRIFTKAFRCKSFYDLWGLVDEYTLFGLSNRQCDEVISQLECDQYLINFMIIFTTDNVIPPIDIEKAVAKGLLRTKKDWSLEIEASIYWRKLYSGSMATNNFVWMMGTHVDLGKPELSSERAADNIIGWGYVTEHSQEEKLYVPWDIYDKSHQITLFLASFNSTIILGTAKDALSVEYTTYKNSFEMHERLVICLNQKDASIVVSETNTRTILVDKFIKTLVFVDHPENKSMTQMIENCKMIAIENAHHFSLQRLQKTLDLITSICKKEKVRLYVCGSRSRLLPDTRWGKCMAFEELFESNGIPTLNFIPQLHFPNDMQSKTTCVQVPSFDNLFIDSVVKNQCQGTPLVLFSCSKTHKEYMKNRGPSSSIWKVGDIFVDRGGVQDVIYDLKIMISENSLVSVDAVDTHKISRCLIFYNGGLNMHENWIYHLTPVSIARQCFSRASEVVLILGLGSANLEIDLYTAYQLATKKLVVICGQ